MLGLIAAGLAAPRSTSAQLPCWEQVVDDWSDGAIARAYPVKCYRQALHRLPEDVLLYSSASDDIGRALASRILATRRPSKAPSRHTASVDAGQTHTPLILVGALAAVLGLFGAAAFVAVRRKSHAPVRRDRWTGASP